MAKILIKNGRVWDGERFFSADVLAEDGIVTAIAPDIEEKANFVFDASGMTVSAGLVDLHMHMLGISIDAFGTQAEGSCYPFGVTAAVDCGGTRGSRELLDAMYLKNAVFVSTSIKENRMNRELTLRRLETFGDKTLGIKTYFDASSGHVLDISPLQEVCALAREKGVKVMVHCADSPEPMVKIIETLAPGDILTHVFHGKVNTCEENNFAALCLAKEKGVVLDAGFAGHVHTDFGVLKRALEAGFLPDTISTDLTNLSAFSRGGRYGMTMCMSIARTAGMAEEDIFRAVTSAPAAAVGKAGKWGSLKVGGTADIAVLKETEEGFRLKDKAGNICESQRGYRCALTVADGRIAYKD